MHDTPDADADPRIPTLDGHFCQTCRWSGSRPVPMGPRERTAVLSALRPGDRVPSGRCPRCRALAEPGPQAQFDLVSAEPADGLPAPAAEGASWDLRLERIGETAVVYLQHPEGQGLECVIEVHGDKPTLSILPWTDPFGIEDAEPLASVKIGADHVALRHAGQPLASAAVCTAEGLHATAPLSLAQWTDLAGWTAEPAARRQPARGIAVPGTPGDPKR